MKKKRPRTLWRRELIEIAGLTVADFATKISVEKR